MKVAVTLALAALFAFGGITLGRSAYGDTIGDVLYSRAGGVGEEFPAAYFPHWVHRIRYKCYACHDAIFPMRRSANPTMAVMAKGESCGACHNGKSAFGLDTCQRCHVQP
jgi:c(7)-type cytochrome triheme protein